MLKNEKRKWPKETCQKNNRKISTKFLNKFSKGKNK